MKVAYLHVDESGGQEKRPSRQEWIEQRLRERGWSEKEIERGERYRRSVEYVVISVIWSLLVLPAPIGLSLIVYGGYVRFRYGCLGERYVVARRDAKREFNRRDPTDSPERRPPERGRMDPPPS